METDWRKASVGSAEPKKAACGCTQAVIRVMIPGRPLPTPLISPIKRVFGTECPVGQLIVLSDLPRLIEIRYWLEANREHMHDLSTVRADWL